MAQDKMKVLQVNTLARTKSTGRTVYEMHKELLIKGIESYVASSYLSIEEGDFGQWIFSSKSDMKVHSLLSRITGLQGYYSKKCTMNLYRYIESINPDIVLLRVLHSNCINVNGLLNYLKSHNIPTIIVLHDLWFVTGHCTYPCESGCEKYKTQCISCNQRRMGNISWFFDRSNRVWNDRKKIYHNWNLLSLVGVSKWATDCAKQASVTDTMQHFRTIYNWIDQDIFKPRMQKRENIFYVMAVSAEWSPMKGVLDFIRLSWKLTDEKLVLVGHIEDKYKKQFNLKLTSFIDYTNSTRELSELYNKADVYVSMSSQETFGKTIAEAICCGTPAIVYDITACSELVSEGAGYAVKFGDVESVYHYIKKIKEDGKDKYLKACLHKAERYFSEERNVQAYIDLFNEMVKERDRLIES